jgi:hypothetical protein
VAAHASPARYRLSRASCSLRTMTCDVSSSSALSNALDICCTVLWKTGSSSGSPISLVACVVCPTRAEVVSQGGRLELREGGVGENAFITRRTIKSLTLDGRMQRSHSDRPPVECGGVRGGETGYLRTSRELRWIQIHMLPAGSAWAWVGTNLEHGQRETGPAHLHELGLGAFVRIVLSVQPVANHSSQLVVCAALQLFGVCATPSRAPSHELGGHAAYVELSGCD